MTEHDERNEESCSRQPSLPLAWEIGRTSDYEGNKTGKRQSRENTEQESRVPGPEQDQGRQVRDDQPGHKKPRRHMSLVNPVPGVEPEARSSSQRTSFRNKELPAGEAGEVQDDRTVEYSHKTLEGKVENRDSKGALPERGHRPLLKTSDWGKGEDEQVGEKQVGYSIIQVPQLNASLGTALMQRRKERGLEISEVCRRTRIPSDFIEHLEADRYEKLPPPVYTRSYIAQLCRVYAMDPQLCLEAYDNAQAARGSNWRGADSLVLVINNDTEDGSLSYTPRPAKKILDQESWILPHLPRIAVMSATVLLLLIVLSAMLIQQYRNYRLRRGVVEDDPAAVTVFEQRIVNLEELIPSHELPLRELPIPRE